jgi:predicted enzyme related to lactoylglutathione lyase
MIQLATRGKRTMSNADIRGRFVWHELMTTDTDAAAAFYSKVVPWKTQDSGMPSYTLWMAGKTQVGGLTGLPSDGDSGTPPHWIVYIATPDVDDTVAAAERLGGKVLKGPTDIPNMGRYAVLTDPQGATFAVYTPPGPPPEGADAASGGAGEFGWHELATTDQDAAVSFYTELFGWEKGATHDMGGIGTYQLIQHNGADVGGIFTLQAPASPPSWLSYVRVADCSKATNAAKSGGGRILNGPMEVPGGSWISQIMDPQGGAFAVMEAPKAAASKPAAKKSAGKTKATAKADAPAEAPESDETVVVTGAPAPSIARKAAARKAPAKAAAKKAPKKAVAKSGGRGGQATSGAGKKVAKKAAKKAAKKVAKKAVGKGLAKSTNARKTNGPAKRGKSAAKKSGAAKRPAKKAKRR